MVMTTRPFDPAAYLDTPEAVATYLSEALETGDSHFIAEALGVVARSHGMSEVARQTGLSRESLYRGLSDTGNPALDTVLRVIGALGLKLTAVPNPEGHTEPHA